MSHAHPLAIGTFIRSKRPVMDEGDFGERFAAAGAVGEIVRIDPGGRYMVVSGEKSDTLSVYEIDRASGALRPQQKYPTGKGSNWVEIVAFE